MYVTVAYREYMENHLPTHVKYQFDAMEFYIITATSFNEIISTYLWLNCGRNNIFHFVAVVVHEGNIMQTWRPRFVNFSPWISWVWFGINFPITWCCCAWRIKTLLTSYKKRTIAELLWNYLKSIFLIIWLIIQCNASANFKNSIGRCSWKTILKR